MVFAFEKTTSSAEARLLFTCVSPVCPVHVFKGLGSVCSSSSACGRVVLQPAHESEQRIAFTFAVSGLGMPCMQSLSASGRH